MAQSSNIRQLLTDTKLGLLPQLDSRLQEVEKKFQQQIETLKLGAYDLELGGCNTIASNEPRPVITQSVTLKLFLTGEHQDKLELFLLASELQNIVDAAILEWSNREWHQFEKPLKRPLTQITGGLEYEVNDKLTASRVTLYRQFDLIYNLSF